MIAGYRNNLITSPCIHDPASSTSLPTNAFFWPMRFKQMWHKQRLKNCFFIRLLFLLLGTLSCNFWNAATMWTSLYQAGYRLVVQLTAEMNKYMSKVILKHVRLQLNEMGKGISTLNCWPIDTQTNKMAISFKQLLNKLALSHSG